MTTLVLLDPSTPERLDRLRPFLPPGWLLTTALSRAPQDQLAALQGAGFAITGDVPVTEAMFAVPGLRAVHKWGVGFDGIDLEAARRHGVRVLRTTGSNAVAVAETTLGLILAVNRNIVRGHAGIAKGRWSKAEIAPVAATLSGRTVGIVGMGRIGRAIARRCHGGFAMEVVFFNRSAVTDLDFPARQIPDLNGMLEQADVAVVAVPGGANTRHLIGAGQMTALGPRGYLVNVARGDVVDEAALIDALVNRRIAGAGLDVYEREPHVPQALLDAPNATLLPHLGTATDDVRTDMGLRALSNLTAFAEGRDPHDRVT